MQSDGSIFEAYIIGLDGVQWAGSGQLPENYEVKILGPNLDDQGSYKVLVSEGENLVSFYKNKGVNSKECKVSEAGVRINGHKFNTVRFDEETNIWQLSSSLNIKDEKTGSDTTKGGATIAVTNVAMIIGLWKQHEGVNYGS